jgi:hypothetical protein
MTNNSLDKCVDIHEKILAAAGTKERSVANSLLALSGEVCATTQKSSENALFTTIDFAKELAPQDLVEGTLITKYWALHTKGMSLLTGGEHSINLAVKLLRLADETLDTFLKWRRKGEQKVCVSYLNVSSGAVVGNLSAGGVGIKMEARS